MATGDSGQPFEGNPGEAGLGTILGDAIELLDAASYTSRNLTIEGDAFFIVESADGERLYTQSGPFYTVDNGSGSERLTQNGAKLLGFNVDEDFNIQTSELVPLSTALGSPDIAEATKNAYLEGTLRPDGDLATTAQQIQTVVLGNGIYATPPDGAVVSQATAPPVISTTAVQVAGAGLPTGDYAYKFVWADGAYVPGNTLSEGAPSDTVLVTTAAPNSVRLTNVPLVPPSAAYDHIRIYRAQTDGPRPTEFEYIDEIGVPAGPAPYTDSTVPNAASPLLNETLLSGHYSYFVTYADQTGGYGVGLETRSSPVSNPLNIVNGRTVLTGLPVTADPSWVCRRIYRNLSSDDSTFYYVGEITNATDATATVSDSESDFTLWADGQTLDRDGPKATAGTLLTDVLLRDGSAYNQIFQEGTLEFTGQKGRRSLSMKEFAIASTSIVQDMIDFMDEALGIRATTADSVNPIPVSTEGTSTASPGGKVEGGRIVLTGNNGHDNAIDIGLLSGMKLRTAVGTENVNMPWDRVQWAVGESAATDFRVYDSLGIPIQVRLTVVMEDRDNTSTTYRWFADSADNQPASGQDIAVGTGRITFNGEGDVVSVSNATVSVQRQNASGVSPLEFELDFISILGLANHYSILAVSRQDGTQPGALTSCCVREDGEIYGYFSNGLTRNLGQIRLARFDNPAGLEQRADNLFAATVDSGPPTEGNPDEERMGVIGCDVEDPIGDASGLAYRMNPLVTTLADGLSEIEEHVEQTQALVTASVNSGVMSDEQIWANQLRIDSSLEAIDRLTQVTQFQGQRILDGSLEFVTRNVDTSRITDLWVRQADFGDQTQIDVSMDVVAQATQAELNYGFGAIADDVVLEVGGKDGFETFSLEAGSTISDIAAAVNLSSHALGVTAEVEIAATKGSITASSYGRGNDVTITADTAGRDEGNIRVKFTADNSAAGTNTTIATYVQAARNDPGTLNVQLETEAWSKAKWAFNADRDQTAKNAFTIESKIFGSDHDFTLVMKDQGTASTTVAYDHATKTLTVGVASDNSSIATDIRDAITADPRLNSLFTWANAHDSDGTGLIKIADITDISKLASGVTGGTIKSTANDVIYAINNAITLKDDVTAALASGNDGREMVTVFQESTFYGTPSANNRLQFLSPEGGKNIRFVSTPGQTLGVDLSTDPEILGFSSAIVQGLDDGTSFKITARQKGAEFDGVEIVLKDSGAVAIDEVAVWELRPGR